MIDSRQIKIGTFVAATMSVALLLFIACTAMAQEPAADSKATTRAESTISGRVVARDGQSLANASVSVARIGAVGPSQGVDVDAGGNFKADGLEPGLYRVFARVPGYITEPAADINSPGFYHPGDSVTLTMIKGGVITGTITNSTNAPVVAALVRAFRVKDQNGKTIQLPGASREVYSDDRGIYRLYGLSPGTYIISAGGPPRFSGAITPSAYETDTPTYAPSSTRDTAVEINLNSGDEITMDIQYHGDAGHSVSGTISGAVTSQGAVSYGASVSLIDVRTRTTIMGTNSSSFNNFVFGFSGVPDGEYELYANQAGPTRDLLMSAPLHIKVQGADISGINLTVAPMASIDGRVVLESDAKASCGKRRDSALLETIVFTRRYQPETKLGATQQKANPTTDVALSMQNFAIDAVADAKGSFSFKNLPAGTYRIDPRAPARGWYVRAIAIEPGAKNVARDGIALRSGERASGLTVTITEGAAGLRGRISLTEGQSLSPAVRVYMVPAERESLENVLRFYESRPESNGSFLTDNVAPGKYWIVARPMEENDSGIPKLIRQDATFRLKVFEEAEALKKEIAFKPCEQTKDYDLPYSSASPNP